MVGTLLAVLAILSAAIAFICVLVGASYGLGVIGALVVFVAYAVVITAVICGWNRFASKLR